MGTGDWEQGEEFSPPPPAPCPSASFQCPMSNSQFPIKL
ncbi:histidine kinase [Nostoc sp. C052]|nr:histidine kinase [Nostoc sp. C052]